MTEKDKREVSCFMMCVLTHLFPNFKEIPLDEMKALEQKGLNLSDWVKYPKETIECYWMIRSIEQFSGGLYPF